MRGDTLPRSGTRRKLPQVMSLVCDSIGQSEPLAFCHLDRRERSLRFCIAPSHGNAKKQNIFCVLCGFAVNRNLHHPRFCTRYRSGAQKTLVKREVGAVLNRRHCHNYVEDQNREMSVVARIFKPQQVSSAKSGITRVTQE